MSVEFDRGYELGWDDAWRMLEEPYPVEVFPPLSEDEIRAAVEAMNGVVRHASERMHAGWARHWADVLRREAPGAVPVEQHR